MVYTIDYFESSPDWKPSLGEALGKTHFRNGHYHAVCDPATGLCKVHHDKHDPHESWTSLLLHMLASRLGTAVLVCAAVGTAAVLDHVFNDGKLRKSITKSVF